jgi:hypothetical protein
MQPISVFNFKSATDVLARYTPGVVVSGTNTYYSDVWSGSDCHIHSLTAFAQGGMTGQWSMWGTDVPEPNLANDDDWIQDNLFTPNDPAGSDAKFGDDVFSYAKHKKRLKYVNISGTGTVRAYVNMVRM